MDRHVLITGGAGFVGANLAVALAERHPTWRITALDNLRRRGSELNLPRLRAAGVAFVHGDVRDPDDLIAIDPIDAVVECSAEPSVLAGTDGDTGYLVRTNLLGAQHCLELARRDGAQMIFLSTSRVYPVAPLEAAAWEETDTRFAWTGEQAVPGLSARGVAEHFPLDGTRTLYGATKLGAEHLVEEYAQGFGLPTVVNRCGVIAGPWQMGKVDQGVFSHWVLSHHAGRPLRYLGYGGSGKQVRDVLHVDDLVDLVDRQLGEPDHWRGAVFNVGGGVDGSLSLLETTALCRELTGREVPVDGADDDPRPGDLRIYVSDCARLFAHTDWRPQRSPRQVLADTVDWVRTHDEALAAASLARP